MWKNKKKDQYLNMNEINGNVSIHPDTFINKSILKGTINVGKKCRVNEAALFGDIELGNYTSIWGPNISLHSKLNKIKIGNFCSIARNTSIQEYNHITDRCSTYFMFQNVFKEEGGMISDIESRGDIVIENDVWIGANCVVVSGAKISNGAIIGANSVVTGEIPPYAIAVGSPAKVIKYRFSPEIIDKLNEINWWNWNETKLFANKNLFKGKLDMKKLDDIV